MNALAFSPLSSAFWPPSISALAYALKPDRRSCRVSRAAWAYSSDQPFIGQPLPYRAVNEAVEPLQGMPLNIALIEPESELVNGPAKMLRADMVEGAVDAALQHGPDASDAVSRNVVASVLAR